MVNIKFCDCCGRQVKDFYGVFMVNQRNTSYTSSSTPQPKTLDLCEGCSSFLQDKMKTIEYSLHIESPEGSEKP